MRLPTSAVRGAFDRRRSTCLLSACHGFSIYVVRVRRAGARLFTATIVPISYAHVSYCRNINL